MGFDVLFTFMVNFIRTKVAKQKPTALKQSVLAILFGTIINCHIFGNLLLGTRSLLLLTFWFLGGVLPLLSVIVGGVVV